MRAWVIIGSSAVLAIVAAVASYGTAPRFAPLPSVVESSRFAPDVAPLRAGERRAYAEMRLGFGPGLSQSPNGSTSSSTSSSGSASGSGIAPSRGAHPSQEDIRDAFDTLAPAAAAGR